MPFVPHPVRAPKQDCTPNQTRDNDVRPQHMASGSHRRRRSVLPETLSAGWAKADFKVQFHMVPSPSGPPVSTAKTRTRPNRPSRAFSKLPPPPLTKTERPAASPAPGAAAFANATAHDMRRIRPGYTRSMKISQCSNALSAIPTSDASTASTTAPTCPQWCWSIQSAAVSGKCSRTG